jgi:integrin beta 1
LVKFSAEENPSDKQCWFYDDDDCRVTFVYGYDDENKFVVRVQKTKECPPVLNILGIILGVIGAVVAIGFALLLLWKLFTIIHDRREFARFEKERQMAKWDTVSLFINLFQLFRLFMDKGNYGWLS